MKSAHGITGNDTASSACSSKVILDVAFSLTLDGWSNRNLKGFYNVTVHWVDVTSLTNKSILLKILDVKCGTSVNKHVGTTLFEYLKCLGWDVVMRLLNVRRECCYRTALLAGQYLHRLQAYAQGQPRLGTDHSIQLIVLKVLTFIKEPTEQLRDALIRICRSKVMRQQYRIKAVATRLASK
ncbi:unnamed protein product [Sphagnum troendelagicum]|uniref:Uncharacterized protein n=1 Tax=Sphagnum troendelagicum TaxID=128251 RepID=A0ABP0UWH8_9BRYO